MRGSHQWPVPMLDKEPGEKPCGCITERGHTIRPCRSHGDVELSGVLMRDPMAQCPPEPKSEVGATPMRNEKSQNTEPIAEESRGPGDVPVLRAPWCYRS